MVYEIKLKPHYVIELLKKYLLLFMASGCFFAYLAYLGTAFLPKEWESTAVIAVKPSLVNPKVANRKFGTITPKIKQKILVFQNEITSRSSLKKLIEKHDLYSLTQGSKIPENKILNVKKSIRIAIKPNTFQISFRSKDSPEKAKIVADEIANMFLQKNDNFVRKTMAKYKAEVKQARDIENHLENIEEQIAKYQKEKQGELDSDLTTNIGYRDKYIELLEKNSQLITGNEEERLAASRQLLSLIDSIFYQVNMNFNKKVSAVAEQKSSIELYTDSENKIQELEKHLQTLLLEYTEAYPEVQKTREAIEALKKKQNNREIIKPKSANKKEPTKYLYSPTQRRKMKRVMLTVKNLKKNYLRFQIINSKIKFLRQEENTPPKDKTLNKLLQEQAKLKKIIFESNYLQLKDYSNLLEKVQEIYQLQLRKVNLLRNQDLYTKKLEEFQKKIANTPTNSLYLKKLNTKFRSLQDKYKIIIRDQNRRGILRTTEGEYQEGGFTILDEGSLPKTTVLAKFNTLAPIAGGGAGIGIILLLLAYRELFHPRIYNSEQLELLFKNKVTVFNPIPVYQLPTQKMQQYTPSKTLKPRKVLSLSSAKQKSDTEDLTEIAKQKSDTEDLTEIAKQKSDTEDLTEIAKQKSDTEDLTEIAKQKSDTEDLTEIAKQKSDTEDLTEIAKQKSDTENLTEIAKQKSDTEDLAEAVTQKTAINTFEQKKNKITEEIRMEVLKHTRKTKEDQIFLQRQLHDMDVPIKVGDVLVNRRMNYQGQTYRFLTILEENLRLPLVHSSIEIQQVANLTTFFATNSDIANRYRKLRFQIFPNPEENEKILFTSTLPQEGKTLISFNIAGAIATGMVGKVIWIDCNFDNPLTSMTKDAIEYGLADVLVGDVDIRDAIKTTQFPRLKVLPAGQTYIDTSELLASQAMSTMCKELEVIYPGHCFVFDVPAFYSSTNIIPLLSFIDKVVYVVDANKTPVGLCEKAVMEIGLDNIKGFVLNKAKTKE